MSRTNGRSSRASSSRRQDMHGAADPAAPAWIRRRGGQIEAEEHEADREVASRRRSELQGSGGAAWLFGSTQRSTRPTKRWPARRRGDHQGSRTAAGCSLATPFPREDKEKAEREEERGGGSWGGSWQRGAPL
ncbi:hypothetical protein VPH35_019115 [Triticum aestivum]|uniref:Uncharacterized protein n=1 Tax=Triticum turgidum subsp. durum TaxID=4567 RepID=A0A9R1NJX7_TRITD|nr:unnamed protein product [Triticum turgidum subsp. durum]